MTRKDEQLKAFLSDPMLQKEYGIEPNKYKTIGEALSSNEPIVWTIATLIDKEDHTEQNVYNEIVNYLNSTL